MHDVARRVADEVLVPSAELVDRASKIPRAHLDALAEAGLFGLAGPIDAGGGDVDPLTMRTVMATIAGGCGATFFVWVQHHGVVGALRRAAAIGGGDGTDETVDAGGIGSDRIEGELVALCSGRRIAGTAFAYLRNRHATGVRADRATDGWRLRGFAPWVTSWGLADRLLVAAVTDDDRIVWALLDVSQPEPPPGLQPGPLALSVFGATGTVTITFDDVVVSDADVLFIEDLAEWRAENRIRSAVGQPASLGVAERSIGWLRSIGDDDAVRTGDRLDQALAARWADDRALVGRAGEMVAARRTSAVDDTSIEAFVRDASAHRTECLELARVASGAFVAAAGGRAMAVDHPAQRLGREAVFYVIQAMTDDGRHAALDAASRSARV